MSGRIALLLLAAWLVTALFGPTFAPHGLGEVVDPDVFGPVSRAFPLGTDYLGRDMLSRVLHAARYTVAIAALATIVAAAAGYLLGLAAAAGGWGDLVLSRVFDTIIAIPALMFGLVAIAALGPSLPVLIGVLAVVHVPGAFRTARALALGIMATDYVTAARARGERLPYIVTREVMPNVVGPLLADLGLRFVFVVLLLSGLSFLGLGVQPPQADLGALVRENIAGLGFGAPAVLAPALAIASLTIAINLMIDSLPSGRR